MYLSCPMGKCPVLLLEAGTTGARLELAVCSPVFEDINVWGDHLCSACPTAAGLDPLFVGVSTLKRCHNNCHETLFDSVTNMYLAAAEEYLTWTMCLYYVWTLEIRCHVLPLIDHGMHSCTRGFLVDSRCDYTCYEGYQIEGDRYQMCQEEGTWSGTQPTCAGTFANLV